MGDLSGPVLPSLFEHISQWIWRGDEEQFKEYRVWSQKITSNVSPPIFSGLVITGGNNALTEFLGLKVCELIYSFSN